MPDAPTPRRTSARRSRIRIGLLVAAIAAAGALIVWTTICPCSTVPGFVLMGDVQREPVTDWRFANDVPLCQIQVSAFGIPHAVNLNCMATPEGDLFLSCSTCTLKFWARHLAENAPGRLRLDGRVYPVVLNRVLQFRLHLPAA
jgi:hypothetical protein